MTVLLRYFFAKGKLDDISPELKAFLDLIMGRSSDDPFVREIEKQLKFAKHNSEWRHNFMKMSIHDQGKFIEGMNRGKAEANQSAAINMNREGLPLDMIARIVHESPNVIQTWIEEESRV